MLFGLGTKAWSAITGSLVLVSAVIAGVAIASQEDFDTIYAPDWKPGYSFSYDVSADVKSVSDGLSEYGLPPTAEFSVGPIPVKKEVLNTQDYRAPSGDLYISAATFPLSNIQSGEILHGMGDAPAFLTAERKSDLAPVFVLPNWECRSSDCPGGALRVMADNPLTYLNFPLTPGKEWSQEAELPIPLPIEELAGVNRVQVAGLVSGMETLELPMGPTQAVRVDFSYTPIGLQETLNQLVEAAEGAGLQVDRFDIQVGIHEIVFYSPEYEAIVKQQYFFEVVFDVAISGEVYGHQVNEDIYATFDAEVQAVLTGVEHAVSEELGPLQILQKVGNADLIADAKGRQGVQQVPYTVSLSPSRTHVNAADEDFVAFGVMLAGVDALPEGHSLQHELSDIDGNVITTGPVSTEGFASMFSTPGVFGVSVQALNEKGSTVARTATHFIEVDYEDTVRGQCSISLLGSRCGPHAFAVTPGAQRLVVEAFSYTGTPPLSESLYVGNDAGYVTTGRGFVDLDAEELAEAGAGKWSVWYENTGGYLSQVDYHIKLDYQAPMTTVVPPPPAHSGGGDGPMGLMARMLESVGAGLGALEGEEPRVDLNILR